MTPAEENQIRSLNEILTREVTLGLRLTDDPRSRPIEDFSRHLARLAPRIRIRGEAAGAGPPAILVGPHLSYCGIPAHHELPPFLEALTFLAEGPPDVPEAIGGRLRQVRPPASMTLYVAPTCQFCPEVVRRLQPLPFVVDGLRLRIVDAALFPEAAEADQVRSVPTVILDRQYRWTGGLTVGQLVEALARRDPSRLDPNALRQLITEGGAHDLARMMCDAGRIFPAFLELLTDENFTVRLAAMVTMEELGAADLTVARQVIGPLWQRYPQLADTVKGDILYVFGELKSPQCRPYLQLALATEENPEVREAAQEALAKTEHP